MTYVMVSCLIVIEQIIAVSSIVTYVCGVGQAVINVEVTQPPLPPLLTITAEGSSEVSAGSMYTGVRFTLIDVYLTVWT